MAIECKGVCKRFGENAVLSGLDWTIGVGERWFVRGASGAGKTTLLRLLLGLETPDAGEIRGLDGLRFSACFQENRLCERLNSVLNCAMVCDAPDLPAIERALCELLPAESIHRPVSTLSGGMARRTALARAVLAPSDVVVLDEPFAGLDEDSRETALNFLERHLGGRTLILVSHELAGLPGARVLHIGE